MVWWQMNSNYMWIVQWYSEKRSLTSTLGCCLLNFSNRLGKAYGAWFLSKTQPKGCSKEPKWLSMVPSGAVVDVIMDSLRGAVESRGHSYITEIAIDILPDERCIGRNEIISATQILHSPGLACTLIFLNTFLWLALLTYASIFLSFIHYISRNFKQIVFVEGDEG